MVSTRGWFLQDAYHVKRLRASDPNFIAVSTLANQSKQATPLPPVINEQQMQHIESCG
jgi:hypothetical protein